MQRSAGRLVCACVMALGLAAVAAAEKPEDRARLLQTRSCAGCDLSAADLKGVNAFDGDLSGADFQRANLYKANLRGSNLQDARFDGANLSGANLEGATGADLANANTDENTTCPNGKKGPC